MNHLCWYAARTNSRSEKTVALALSRRGVDHYLPLYNKIGSWKNGLKPSLDLPLFPGYLFVKIAFLDRLTVLQTPGISGLVSFGSRPAPLPDDEMNVLRDGLSRYRAEPHPYLNVGDKILVRRGPLAGVSGYLIRKRNALRFVISIDLVMQSVAVELDAADVDSIPLSN